MEREKSASLIHSEIQKVVERQDRRGKRQVRFKDKHCSVTLDKLQVAVNCKNSINSIVSVYRRWTSTMIACETADILHKEKLLKLLIIVRTRDKLKRKTSEDNYVVQEDMQRVGVRKENAMVWVRWRKMIQCAKP